MAERSKMASKGVELDREIFSCPICVDLLKDPVTLPCGHNYCMDCINAYWDSEGGKQPCVCPQCRKAFAPRPVLLKNTTLAAVAHELKKTGLQDPADPGPAGSENVACGVCAGRSVKTRLVCLVSFCEEHLQPHHQTAPLTAHQLVEPRQILQENHVCARHGEVKTVFCRTDQQCVCSLCSAENHQGHELVPAAAERREKQRRLTERRQGLQQMIREREEEAAALQQKAALVGHSADQAVKDSNQILTQVIQFLESQRGDVENRVRSRQEAQAGRVRADQEDLELLITKLRSREEELGRLFHTGDDSQFLQRLASLPPLGPPSVPSPVSHRSPSGFEDVTAALSQIANTLPKVFSRKMSKVSQKTSEMDCLAPQEEPRGRGDFLKYSRKITLDAETAHPQLHLSAGRTRATVTGQSSDLPSHPGSFAACCQVLGKEDVTGRSYWEVKWDGAAVYIAVAYADVRRDGGWTESGFGFSDKSWALYCDKANYMFCHNSCTTPVLGPPSARLGVYLDHSAGVLSFHSIGSKTTTLLHRVHATFTQPLRAGFWLYSYPGNKVEIVKV